MDYSNSEKLSVSLEPCLPLFVVYRDQDEEDVQKDDLELESEHQDPESVSHGCPQVTRQGSLVCSFCGLSQPSHHLLNEHHLDHIEEDCKYCPYCCFTCLAPRTLKKHLREHAAHNQMCHRHCHYMDMHDPNGDFYIDGEDDSESSFEEASDELESTENESPAFSDNKGPPKLRKPGRPPTKSSILPAFSSPKKSVASPLSLAPELPVDALSLLQVSELLRSSMLASGTLKNGLNTSSVLEKLLLAQLQSSMSTNGHRTEAGIHAPAREVVDKAPASVPPRAVAQTPPSDMDYSDFLENTHDSIAEKIQSFFQPDDGSVDGELVEDSEDGDMSYSCPTCRFTCSHRSVLTRHLTTHSESFQVKGKVYLRCPQCPFCSSSKSNLHRHIATHSRKLGCPASETLYSGSINWDGVAKGPKVKVPVPSKEPQAPHQPSLPTILNGKTLLFCTVCDYTSYYKSNLNRHMARHGVGGDPAAGESNFNDSNSPESSPNSPSPPPPPEPEQGLPPPAREPVPKQVLTCKSCVYTTHNLSNFRKHSLIHSQSKNLWHCCMCTYSSFEKSNVKRHIRMKHRQSGEGVADLDIFCYMKKEKKFYNVNGKIRSLADGESSLSRPEHDGEGAALGNEFPTENVFNSEACSSFPCWSGDEEMLAASRWNELSIKQQLSRALLTQLCLERTTRAAEEPELFDKTDHEMTAVPENESSISSCGNDLSWEGEPCLNDSQVGSRTMGLIRKDLREPSRGRKMSQEGSCSTSRLAGTDVNTAMETSDFGSGETHDGVSRADAPPYGDHRPSSRMSEEDDVDFASPLGVGQDLLCARSQHESFSRSFCDVGEYNDVSEAEMDDLDAPAASSRRSGSPCGDVEDKMAKEHHPLEDSVLDSGAGDTESEEVPARGDEEGPLPVGGLLGTSGGPARLVV